MGIQPERKGGENLVNKESKIFFVLFFGAILVSIALTAYTIYIEGDYYTFSEEEEVPDPLETYHNFLERISGSESEEPE